jgi:uncharacterized protein (DUF983 family)
MPKASTYLTNVLQLQCPRCREGKLFKGKNPYNFKTFMDMHDACPVCQQPTEIEVGFYYGTGYVSYALTVALCVSTFVAWYVLIGFSFSENAIFYWLGANAVLILAMQPLLMRFSRAVWLSWFVKYDKHWKKHAPESYERVNDQFKHGW